LLTIIWRKLVYQIFSSICLLKMNALPPICVQLLFINCKKIIFVQGWKFALKFVQIWFLKFIQFLFLFNFPELASNILILIWIQLRQTLKLKSWWLDWICFLHCRWSCLVLGYLLFLNFSTIVSSAFCSAKILIFDLVWVQIVGKTVRL